MKKLFLLLITAAIIQIVYSQDKIPKPNWQLRSEDTYIKIAVTNNRPVIYELKNSKNGWNWIKGISEMPFPEKVQFGTTTLRPVWKYTEAIVGKTTGTKLTLRFVCNRPNMVLESVWEARQGVGPVENQVSIKNISGESIKLQDADIL